MRTDDPGARSAACAADLPPAAGHVRARRGRAAVRRRRARVSRPAVGHRRRVARPRASGAGAGDRRTGADAAAHVEPVLSPAAGPARRAAGAPVRAAARVLLQQRHRSGRGVPEVRAPLLVHARRAARRDRRARRVVPRPHVSARCRSRPTSTIARRSSRCWPGVQLRARRTIRRRSRPRSRRTPRRSSSSRFRAKAASGR